MRMTQFDYSIGFGLMSDYSYNKMSSYYNEFKNETLLQESGLSGWLYSLFGWNTECKIRLIIVSLLFGNFHHDNINETYTEIDLYDDKEIALYVIDKIFEDRFKLKDIFYEYLSKIYTVYEPKEWYMEKTILAYSEKYGLDKYETTRTISMKSFGKNGTMKHELYLTGGILSYRRII